MAYHTTSLKKSEETRGNAVTQPRSHPIPKFYVFLMGWDRRWVIIISPCFFTFLRGGVQL